MRAVPAWLTSQSTRALRGILAISSGLAATLFQLSPWSATSTIGYVIFWVAVGSVIVLLIAEWPIRLWRLRRADQFVVPRKNLLKGSYIDSVVAIGRSIMGDGHANAETMRARLGRCPDGLIVLVRRAHRRHVSDQVVGYFACWTITSAATERFASGEYHSALDLQDDDFTVDSPAAAYVTMLYGLDAYARRKIIEVAATQLRDQFGQTDQPSLLLARPATHDGELMMKRTGMKPLHGADDVVWSIDRAALHDSLAKVGL